MQEKRVPVLIVGLFTRGHVASTLRWWWPRAAHLDRKAFPPAIKGHNSDVANSASSGREHGLSREARA